VDTKAGAWSWPFTSMSAEELCLHASSVFMLLSSVHHIFRLTSILIKTCLMIIIIWFLILIYLFILFIWYFCGIWYHAVC
jgi:hypothetical protein